MPRQLRDRLHDLLARLLVGDGKLVGDDRVEDDVGVRRPGHHAKVVDAHGRVQRRAHGILHLDARLAYQRIVGVQRVHVDDGVAVQLRLEALLDGVDDVVQFVHVAVRRHFGVQRHHEVARAVFVDDEVVYADDLLIFLDDGAYAAHQFRVGRAAEQGRDGVLGGVVAAPEDE